MTIRYFQIFKAVCDNNGITAAAERLNITQPSVSMVIKELEAFYGTKLFDRINRNIYLTEAGVILRKYVENILEQYNEADIIIQGKKFSKCRIGVNIFFAEANLTKLTKMIKSTLPECELQIFVHSNEKLNTMLSSNQIDFAVFDDIKVRKSTHIELLLKERMVLLVSDSLYEMDTITLEELSKQPLLLHERGVGVRETVDRIFLSHGLPQNVIMESESTMSLFNMAEQGMGFIFVPISLVNKQKGTLHKVDIQSETIIQNHYLAYNEGKNLTFTMSAIEKIIKKYISSSRK